MWIKFLYYIQILVFERPRVPDTVTAILNLLFLIHNDFFVIGPPGSLSLLCERFLMWFPSVGASSM